MSGVISHLIHKPHNSLLEVAHIHQRASRDGKVIGLHELSVGEPVASHADLIERHLGCSVLQLTSIQRPTLPNS